jgi:hypothetical protein
MIFAVDFGQAQTGVGYQFLDSAGNLLGVHSTTVSPGSLPGMYFVELQPPLNAIAITWDCNEGITARDDFQELLRLESLAGQVSPPPVSISYPFALPGSLAAEFDNDLAEAIFTYEQAFTWKGRSISCVLNMITSRIITAKAFFGSQGARVYPQCGDVIIAAGVKAQIIKKGNAEIKAVAGGFVEDPAFVDDASEPALVLEYSHQITR